MKQRFFDAHCDTISEVLEKGQNLKKNFLHLDLNRLEEYDGYLQVFAAFIDKKNIRTTPQKHCMSLLESLRKELKYNLVTTWEDLKATADSGKIGAILAIEGGEALTGSLEMLNRYYQMGVRLITLTWNYANELGEGVLEDSGGGLTEFGRQAVIAMEELGIVIDVSHLSPTGFWDVAKHTKYPFIASHSNVKALCNHPRNLDNEQIEFLIRRKGCIGINFFPEFLVHERECDVSDIIQHMEYILSLGGEDCIGFGSDFDGISSLPKGIAGVQDMREIKRAMKDAGFQDEIIEKICFSNFYRIFWETLGRR
ncbi:MAG: dipeptidase, partial [Clostridia bacterium]|nr:dipeptidase [Clostridia bacterium]